MAYDSAAGTMLILVGVVVTLVAYRDDDRLGTPSRGAPMVPLSAITPLGLLLGLILGLGLWLVSTAVPRIGRPRLVERVAPYVADLSPAAREMLARRPSDPTPSARLRRHSRRTPAAERSSPSGWEATTRSPSGSASPARSRRSSGSAASSSHGRPRRSSSRRRWRSPHPRSAGCRRSCGSCSRRLRRPWAPCSATGCCSDAHVGASVESRRNCRPCSSSSR